MEAGRSFTLRRSDFLQGYAKTFYGPGQMPVARQTPVTDWPVVGSLFRVPQVCALNIHFRVQFLGPIYPQEVVFYDINHPNSAGGMTFVVNSRNSSYYEYHRLLPEIQEAKSRIEGVRKNRTWVGVWDWVADGSPLWSVFGPGFLQFPSPNSEPGSFFGTDFLNVWLGGAVFGQGSSLNEFSYYSPPPNPEGDGLIAIPYSRLKSTYESFRGYKSKLFHRYGDWSDAYTVKPSDQADFDRWNSGFYDIPANGVKYVRRDPVGASVEAQNDEGNGETFDYFQSVLSEQGVTHDGSTNSVTSDYLVKLIADHYGFDPETGEDLV